MNCFQKTNQAVLGYLEDSMMWKLVGLGLLLAASVVIMFDTILRLWIASGITDYNLLLFATTMSIIALGLTGVYTYTLIEYYRNKESENGS